MPPRGFRSLVYLWNRRHHSYNENIKEKNLLVILFMRPLSYCESLSSSFHHFQSVLPLSLSSPSNTTVIFFWARMFHQVALWGRHGRSAKLHLSCLWWDSVWQLPLVHLCLHFTVCCHPVITGDSSAEPWHTDLLSKHGTRKQVVPIWTSFVIYTVAELCRFRGTLFFFDK